MPEYSSVLRGPNFDKSAHSWAVNTLGYRYVVLMEGFLLHQPHAPGWHRGSLSPRNMFLRNKQLLMKVVRPHFTNHPLGDKNRRGAFIKEQRKARLKHISQAESLVPFVKQLEGADTWKQRFEVHTELQTAMRAGKVAPRYVFVQTNEHSGLGNRWLTLVSAYLLAVLSHRALVVDWPSSDSVVIHPTSNEIITMVELQRLVKVTLP